MIMRKACLPLISILCLTAMSGCTTGDNTGNSPAAGEYVAVQENLMSTCIVISGSYNLPPHMVPGHIFIYNGALDGVNPADNSSWSNFRPEILDGYYPEVNGSLKALYATVYYRDVAPADTRTGLRVRGVYGLPYVFESGFALREIDGNGTIYGTYNNTSIVLHAGEQWCTPLVTEIKSGRGTGLDQKPFGYTASYNTTWRISNLGVFDKANLTRYNNSAGATGFNEVYTGADPAGG
jgi:hypothetical protein